MLRIKEIIKNKGLTIQEVADKLGISRVGLSQQINGAPRLDSLQKIADALDVDLLDLFEDKRETNTSIKCPNCGTDIFIDVRK